MAKKRITFERIVIFAFILIIMFAFSYKFGGYFYDILPWFFFISLVATLTLNVIGILLFPIAVQYQTFFYNKLTFLPAGITTLYAILIIGILAYFILSKKEEPAKDANFALAIILVLVALLTTIINGYNVGFGNSELSHYIEASLIVILLSTFISNKKRLRIFVWIVTLAVATLALRYYNHTYTYDLALPGFENNYLARIFSFYVPFLLGVFWSERDKYLKGIALIAFAFAAQGITQLGSRATYIALGVAMSLMFIKNMKRKSIWIFAALGLILLMFFTPPSFFNDLRTIPKVLTNPQSEGSTAGRLDIAKLGTETFYERPILGWGVAPSIFEKTMYQRYDWYKSGHNSYIIIAVEMGVLGLLTYIALFAFSIYNCYKAQKLTKNKHPYIYHISQGTMFGLIAISINQAMLNNPWIETAFIGIGLSSALYAIAKKITSSSPKPNYNKTSSKKEESSTKKDQHNLKSSSTT